ncbi:hypothetical protein PF004_g25331 [Phytophthora fragariae]|uniref:Uncharacterized protein n=1 Tax=Phytophthora fragariae TaxID=53985 RepID=A0A6G0MRK9_9STRA|nr:hypothetical protein PF004_g25331 [Phytophthora fragariae]
MFGAVVVNVAASTEHWGAWSDVIKKASGPWPAILGASFVRAVLLKRPNFHAGTQLAGPHTVRRSVGAMARTRNTDKIQKRLKEEERQAKAAAEEKKAGAEEKKIAAEEKKTAEENQAAKEKKAAAEEEESAEEEE